MSDPTVPRYESAAEKQIRLAQERGAFDNLPGRGKPLPGLHDADDELWWIKGYLRREGLSGDELLPPAIQLRKEIERLPGVLRALRSEEAVRDTVAELNLRIVEYLRAPVGPRLPVGKIDVDAAVRRWHADRPTRPARVDPAPVDTAPVDTAPDEPVRVPWWRRLGRRR